MFSRNQLTALFGATVLAVLAAASAQALTAQRTTYVSFTRPVALPGGLELTAGTYVFELAEPGNQFIVRVLSKDRRRVYTTQVTNLVQRPDNVTDGHAVTLAEAPAGMARPVRAWYPSGDLVGHEFIYRR